jgi:hypothetical protein
MSIADHFDRAPDAGFIRTYQPGAARRQLNLSFVMMAVLALVATALAFTVRFDAPEGASGAGAGVSPAYVGRLWAASGPVALQRGWRSPAELRSGISKKARLPQGETEPLTPRRCRALKAFSPEEAFCAKQCCCEKYQHCLALSVACWQQASAMIG